MGDTRIHPNTTTINTVPTPPSSKHSGGDQLPPKYVSPPTTHVVQFPRENILRYPPPENATKYQSRVNRQSSCRRCCCYTICLLLLLAVAAAVSAGVLYVVFQFNSPEYKVTRLAIRGMNMNVASSAQPVSPGFDVSIWAENPNDKIGIYYLKDSSVEIFFGDVKMGGGVLPEFYQPRKNVTVLRTALTGDGVAVGDGVRTALRDAQNQKRVPFVVRANVPVKIKVGSVKTWQIIFKVKCDVAMKYAAALNERERIVSKNCDFRVRLW